MDKTGEYRISGATFFQKFVLPAMWLGGVAFCIGLSFFEGIQGRQGSLAVGSFCLVLFGAGLFFFATYSFPLMQVWLGEEGLRVSNFRDSVVIPYGAIESVVQKTETNLRPVVVNLKVDAPFGRRFTFIPRNPKRPWPFSRGEDEVVVALREWVEVAREHGFGKFASNWGVGPGRSPMADDELDGPP